MKNNELEIYVHIPFCARKCDYCDFVSFPLKDEIQAKYFAALHEEIEKRSETMGNVPVVSCFFGGGTPSFPNELYIVNTLKFLKQRFSFDKDAEITIEMNPNSGSFEKLKAYKAAGFNRLSIGLQSTVESELRALSRLHTYEEFKDTYENARKAGFENINIDLMSALPGQTLDSYKKSLERVVSLSPEHISAYSLMIEEGTPFFERYKDGQGLPSEDEEREMYYFTKAFLQKNGYDRYEISNYSRPGFECRHNLGYWRRVQYMGFGISAASLLKNERSTNHSDIGRYIERDFSAEKEILSGNDIIAEYMFLGLRCVSGIDKKDFFVNFGVNVEDVYSEEINKLKRMSLLCEENNHLFLTDKGMDVANYCMSEFIID